MTFLRIFLAACLFAAAPGVPPVRAAAPPASCAICGHECCCPDVCARILKERRTAGCAAAACRLGERRTEATLSDAHVEPPRTTALWLSARIPLSVDGTSHSVDSPLPTFTPPAADVRTPPPRAA